MRIKIEPRSNVLPIIIIQVSQKIGKIGTTLWRQSEFRRVYKRKYMGEFLSQTLFRHHTTIPGQPCQVLGTG